MGGDIGSLETIYLGKEVAIEIKVMLEEKFIKSFDGGAKK